MPQTAEEVERILVEIMLGYEWGDPRSEVRQTAENKRVWFEVAKEVVELEEKGIVVEVPFEVPFPE